MNDSFRIYIEASKSIPIPLNLISSIYLGKCIFREFKILNIFVAAGILKEEPVLHLIKCLESELHYIAA